MNYRPNERLLELRALDDCLVFPSLSPSSSTPSSLLLPWLRSLFLAASTTGGSDGLEKGIVSGSVARPPHWAVAVERVTVGGHRNVLPALVHSTVVCFPQLSELDLRRSGKLDDSFLIALSRVVPQLKSLRLPPRCSGVTSAGLDGFRRLALLDAIGCSGLRHVHFCAATLKVLIANCCDGLTDDGLANATKLQELYVYGCRRVTTIEPFSHTLRVLDASDQCGISGEALREATGLQVLSLGNNPHDFSHPDVLQPFAHRLRELDAGSTNMGNEAIRSAQHLVWLDLTFNMLVTSVDFCHTTLRALWATNHTALTDEGIASAVQLTSLSVMGDETIRTLTPFASTLLYLNVAFTEVTDAHLRELTKLVWLDVTACSGVTTLAPFCATLRHLAAGEECGLDDAALAQVAGGGLVSLDYSCNPKITITTPTLFEMM